MVPIIRVSKWVVLGRILRGYPSGSIQRQLQDLSSLWRLLPQGQSFLGLFLQVPLRALDLCPHFIDCSSFLQLPLFTAPTLICLNHLSLVLIISRGLLLRDIASHLVVSKIQLFLKWDLGLFSPTLWILLLLLLCKLDKKKKKEIKRRALTGPQCLSVFLSCPGLLLLEESTSFISLRCQMTTSALSRVDALPSVGRDRSPFSSGSELSQDVEDEQCQVSSKTIHDVQDSDLSVTGRRAQPDRPHWNYYFSNGQRSRQPWENTKEKGEFPWMMFVNRSKGRNKEWHHRNDRVYKLLVSVRFD